MRHFFDRISDIDPHEDDNVYIRLKAPGKRYPEKRSAKKRKICWIEDMFRLKSENILGKDRYERENDQYKPRLIMVEKARCDESGNDGAFGKNPPVQKYPIYQNVTDCSDNHPSQNPKRITDILSMCPDQKKNAKQEYYQIFLVL